MRPFTFSGFERVLACIGSAVLPHVGSITVAADKGTETHSFLRNCNVLGQEAALQLIAEKERARYAVIDVSRLPISVPGRYASEVAIAYDPVADTARELGRDIDRRYGEHGAKDTDICGSLDVVGLTDEWVEVIDWKSGGGFHVTPARKNQQLRIQALAAARAYGRSRARVAIGHIPDDGDPWLDWHELDDVDLDMVAADVRKVLGRIENARKGIGFVEATVVEGAHCRYCPALPCCPAKNRLALSLGGIETEERLVPALTPENAPLVVAKLLAAEELLKKVRADLEELARIEPVRLGDGKVFGPVVWPREEIDPAKGAILLSEKYGADVGLSAIENKQTITKTKLKEGLRKYVERTKGARIGKTYEEALSLLRLNSAVRVTVTYPVMVHTPEPEEALPEPKPAAQLSP